ncbi:unnamed protein product [Hapterophycus canaliculatus]
MCQYVDDEGMVIDEDVRDALLRAVDRAIMRMPDSEAVVMDGGGGGGGGDDAGAVGGDGSEGVGGVDGEWKVEGTNATAEELWALDKLVHGWLLDEEEDDEEDDEEEEEGGDFEVSLDASDEVGRVGREKGAEVGADEWNSDAVDYDGGDMNTAMTVEDIEHGAEDVIDFVGDEDDEEEDDDDDSPGRGGGGVGGAGGGEKNAAPGVSRPPPRRIARTGEQQEDDGGAHGTADDHWSPPPRSSSAELGFPDFGGGEFYGDLIDQMSELHPDQEDISFKMHGEDWEDDDDDDDDDDFFPAAADRYRRRGDGGGGGGGGQMRGSRRRGGGPRGRPGAFGGRRSVYADLVMPYGNPREEGGQGIVSIPVKITTVQESDDDDDDDDSGSGGGGGGLGAGGGGARST